MYLRKYLCLFASWFVLSSAGALVAQVPALQSLRQVPVPRPSNLGQFIADEAEAIRLGKALFWDMQLGSDGIMACASCHFHAGADNRAKNQISPGLLRVDSQFKPNPDKTFQVGGPNYTLRTTDFPFRKLKNINDASSTVISDRNDIASSQGVHLQQFLGLDANGNEVLMPLYDDTFRVGSVSTRRVEPRNTPTTINSVFNQRNFWDGRAVDIFNGVNPFGLRDTSARVYYAAKPSDLLAVSVAIDNASLASQCVGPPLSAFEMSGTGKMFPELGRKMLSRRPLALQIVHPDDSVLGPMTLAGVPGLNVESYAAMIRKAFRPEWWQSNLMVTVDPLADPLLFVRGRNSSNALSKAVSEPLRSNIKPAGFTQMESNFSLFFGLAILLYESKLVSEQTPYDRYVEGNQAALTTQQKEGLNLFLNKGRCVNCHGGAEFTNASVQNAKIARIERMLMGDGKSGVYDAGFYNIAVRPTNEDLGLGDFDPFGNPLSEARLLSMFGATKYKLLVGVSPSLTLTAGERTVFNGAFKTPGLRNVELTAPYFHNGGQRTLREVIDFYNRGGDFRKANLADVDADIIPLGLTTKEKDALVAFLMALTDERVRYRQAPFDHPQLFIPNGHAGTTTSVTNDGTGKAADTFMELPATGKFGGVPLNNFLQ